MWIRCCLLFAFALVVTCEFTSGAEAKKCTGVNQRMNSQTGECECIPPFLGPDCQFNVCLYCDRTTEVCNEENRSCDCKLGFERVGNLPKCTKAPETTRSGPDQAKKCTGVNQRMNSQAGECRCIPPFSGPDCQFNICLYCDRTTEVCNKKNRCCDCIPGFELVGNSSKCTKAPETTGSGADQAKKCTGVHQIMNSQTGECECAPPFSGPDCKFNICLHCDRTTEVCNEEYMSCDCISGFVRVANSAKCAKDICSHCDKTTEVCNEEYRSCDCKSGFERVGDSPNCTKIQAKKCTGVHQRMNSQTDECECAHPFSGPDCQFNICLYCDRTTEVCNKENRSCDCIPGFELVGNSSNCTKAPETTRSGPDQVKKCTGVNQRMNSQAGECRCIPPFSGPDCQFNVCLYCDIMTEVCNKENRSCDCKLGFERVGNLPKCTKAPETTRSDQAKKCTGVNQRMNSQTGECECIPPFSGPDCQFNICLHCDRTTEVCNEKSRSCDCKPEFQRVRNSAKCAKDICSHCDRTTEVCNEEYRSCDCISGFERVGDSPNCTKKECSPDSCGVHEECNNHTVCVCETDYTRDEETGTCTKKVVTVDDSASIDTETNGSASTHFLAYFLVGVVLVLCIAGYVIYHNSKKVLWLKADGRPNRKDYARLEENV